LNRFISHQVDIKGNATMISRIRKLTALMFVAGISGCGSGITTYPVEGDLEIVRGEVAPLSGSVVEAVLDGDPTVRASGEISPEGQFRLETLHAGQIVKGAPQGVYKARIVLSDDDKNQRRLAAKAVAPRYFKFDTSGMMFTVPSNERIVLKATKS
jgi:hypothetical protein